MKTPCETCNNTVQIPDDAESGYIQSCDTYHCDAFFLVERNMENSSLVTFGEVQADAVGKFYEVGIQAGDNLKECDKCEEDIDVGEKAYPEHKTPRKVTVYCERCRKIKAMDDGLKVDNDRDSGGF